MKENMYYGASHLIFQKAEELRNRMTPAEEILWKHLHINEWKLKFRRQHPIWNYVTDFYCHGIKLVIELDGGIHEIEEVKKNDEVRETHLKEFGLTVLRFKNDEVVKDINSVLKRISQTIETRRNTSLGDGGKPPLYIIKIGGNVIDDEKKLSSFLKEFADFSSPLQGTGAYKILVHGGGKLATRLAEQLKIPQQVVDGRRITDAETLKIVTMVYAGYINKNIVAQLQASNCNAIGLCGADGDAILAHKRQHPVMDYGFVGDVDAINTDLISSLLEKNITPVFAPITHDQQGQLLNTNADTIAQEVAKGMSNEFEVTLIYSFEKSGVLLDANDDNTVIPVINPSSYKKLKDGEKIFAGMIPKLDNAFAALNSGVKKVIIGKAEKLKELIAGTTGTSITNE
jgi:acetylglutamate kinase